MKRILVIKPSSFGDILHGLLIAESIRLQRPDMIIDWVVRDTFAPIVEVAECVNGRVIHFQRKGGIRAIVEVCRHISQHEYDAVLDMQGLARSAIMACSARSLLKIGRADAREGSKFACNRLIHLPKHHRKCHAVVILQAFLPALGLQPDLPAKVSFRNATDSQATPCCTGSILMFPDSRRAEKEWHGFVRLSEELLLGDPSLRVTWLGMGGPKCSDFLIQHPGFSDWRGRTPLEQLPSLVSRARLVIANDSGPMHLAAALGVPIVAMFGPTEPDCFGPWPLTNPNNTVLRAHDGDLRTLSVETAYCTVSELLACL